MKAVNLISIVNAHKSLRPELRKSYFKNSGIEPEEEELNDLSILVQELEPIYEDPIIFDNYFLGYEIPQISKEFDLLRFGDDSIINIELKSCNTGDKIKYQLKKNRYYLGFLGKEIHNFTFVSDEKKLYTLNEDEELIESKLSDLENIIVKQGIKRVHDIDSLFDPSNYLVSPVNSPAKFIEEQYFLTSQQEDYKKEILKKINNPGTTFVSISGKAGTGKTLLTYDIAKEYIDKGKKVLIIHCGIVNEGHEILQDIYSWDIIPVKRLYYYNLAEYFLVIVDETQRIYINQLRRIIFRIKIANGNCVFSYDKKQCLKKEEIDNNSAKIIEDLTSAKVYDLTQKIRTNKEIADFILALFNKRKFTVIREHPNIELNYFNRSADARDYIEQLGNQDWKVINYTPSRDRMPYQRFEIPHKDSAHEVIGQEFDNVVAVIDRHFYYEGNQLHTKDYPITPFYHPTNMLFQIMTRTRKKLNVIIIDNELILERCLKIFGYPVESE